MLLWLLQVHISFCCHFMVFFGWKYQSIDTVLIYESVLTTANKFWFCTSISQATEVIISWNTYFYLTFTNPQNVIFIFQMKIFIIANQIKFNLILHQRFDSRCSNSDQQSSCGVSESQTHCRGPCDIGVHHTIHSTIKTGR